MLKQKEESLYVEQKKSRPKIEEIAKVLLFGEQLTHLLKFVEYLHNNKLSPVWASSNSWKVSCKGKGLLYIKIPYESANPDSGRNTWYIDPIGYYDDDCKSLIEDDSYKDVVLSCVKQCHACFGRYIGKKRSCNFGTDRTICGKEFKNVCGYLHMVNPNNDVLDFLKVWIQTKTLKYNEPLKSR